MGFWCCVVVPKTALLFIPLLIYIWNRFLQPIWSNFWNGEEKLKMDKETTNENSSVNVSLLISLSVPLFRNLCLKFMCLYVNVLLSVLQIFRKKLFGESFMNFHCRPSPLTEAKFQI